MKNLRSSAMGTLKAALILYAILVAFAVAIFNKELIVRSEERSTFTQHLIVSAKGLIWPYYVFSQSTVYPTFVPRDLPYLPPSLANFFDALSDIEEAFDASLKEPPDMGKTKALVFKSSELISSVNTDDLQAFYSGWGDTVQETVIPAIRYMKEFVETDNTEVANRAVALMKKWDKWNDAHGDELRKQISAKYLWESS